MGIRAPDSTAMNLLQAGILAVLAIALPITVQSKDCGTWMSKSSWSCCSTSNRCGVGQGDCDRDSDCQDGLICGNDNCPSFIPGAHRRADCCTKQTGLAGCAKGWQKLGNKCFYFSTNDRVRSFDEGEARCKSMHSSAHLASIESQEEQDLISAKGLWWPYIGATDKGNEGRWEWSDGTPWKYENWRENEPNNLGGNEHCAFTARTWNDVSCNSVGLYICSYRIADASVLLIGGENNSMEIWNPYLSINYPEYKLPNSGPGSRAASFNGKYYSCGGYPSSKTKGECFSTFPGQLNWVPSPSMEVARFSHTMTTVGDKLVVTGGRLDYETLDSIEIFQPKSWTNPGGWTNPGWTLNAARTRHCAVAWSSTELILIAGFDSKGRWTDTVTMYDVTTGKSHNLPNFPRKACCLACTKYKGNVVAGRNKQVWMLRGDKWVPLPSLNYNRISYALKEIGGKLYALGGEVNFVEVLDGKKWSVTNTSLAAPYENGGAIII